MRYDPEDETGYQAWRDDIVARFEVTADGRDRGWVASQVLDFKATYLDGNLAHWATRDLDEILLGLYPAKVMLDEDDLSTIPTAFAAFMRFLGTESVVCARTAERLATHVVGKAAAFRDAALNEANWSMGKRLRAQAAAEGVEADDELAMAQFVDAFNRRPFEERDAILGPTVAPASRRTRLRPLPAVVLAPVHELKRAADESITMQRIRRLIDYVGDGRALTDKGNLKLADGKELIGILETDDVFDRKIGDHVFTTRSTVALPAVDLTFHLAAAAGFITVTGKKASPGPNGSRLDDAPPEALFDTVEALLDQVGPTRHRWKKDTYGWDWFTDELDRYFTDLLIDLYRHGGAAIPDLVEDSWDYLNEVYDLSEQPLHLLSLSHDLVESAIRRALDRFVDLGAVRVWDVEEIRDAYGTTDRFGGSAELTDLGRWVVQRLAARFTKAPVIGGLRDASAGQLLAAAADMGESEAAAEIDLWIADHGATAASQLVAALRTGDATVKRLALGALAKLGPRADKALADLSDDPEFAPLIAVWRADQGNGLDCGEDAEQFVRLVYAAIELHGLEAAGSHWADAAAASAGVAPLLERAWRVRLPETEEVLNAIGAHHPDKATAKIARKALFKHRTAS